MQFAMPDFTTLSCRSFVLGAALQETKHNRYASSADSCVNYKASQGQRLYC